MDHLKKMNRSKKQNYLPQRGDHSSRLLVVRCTVLDAFRQHERQRRDKRRSDAKPAIMLLG